MAKAGFYFGDQPLFLVEKVKMIKGLEKVKECWKVVAYKNKKGANRSGEE